MQCPRCYGNADLIEGPDFMEMDTARRATEWFITRRNKNNRGAYIMLFGGEPLLNWQLIAEYLPWFRHEHQKENLKLHVFTNGLELSEEKIDFLLDHRVGIYLSLDGDYSIYRQSRNISESRFQRLIELVRYKPGSIAPSCVVEKKHLKNLGGILDYLRQLDIRALIVAKSQPEIWSTGEKQLLLSTLRAFKKTTGIRIQVLPESISGCTDCIPQTIYIWPNGNIYDLCILGPNLLYKMGRCSEEEFKAFHYGNIATTDELHVDFRHKRNFIFKQLDCPTITTDRNIIKELAC